MKKLFFLAAVATMTLASCMNDEYLGENSTNTVAQESTLGAIRFGGNAGNVTRATSNTGTVAEMLDHHFKFYGVKNVSGYTDVFKNYAAWDVTTKTTSNPDGAEADADNTKRMNGWEYVGDGSAKGGIATQTIKYWDWAATDYHFVAGSPSNKFTFNTDIVSGDIVTATVTGIAGHININNGTPGTTTYYPVYIADPVKVLPANYNKEVTLEFTRQQTLVRVGVFETIPGYSITDIKFYDWSTSDNKWSATPTNNITLASKTANYFQGAADATATVTYNWTAPNYTFAYSSGLTPGNNWYGGQLVLSSSNKLATSSTDAAKDYFYGTDKDMAADTRYFTVLPSPSALVAQPILVKCDYTLTADDGEGETIHVSGATAAIPDAFCKWKQNTSYTYLFKISNNTNGKTDVDQPDEGLYPITFDAVVIAEEDATKQGYITTVSTPSITTYQGGSVTAAGIQYKTGTAIYFTAQNDETGGLNNLTAGVYGTPAPGGVNVFKLDAAATEADLILTRPAEAKLFTFTVGASETTINGEAIAANKYASFTPNASGTYAIEYCTQASPAAYAYKVVTVVAP